MYVGQRVFIKYDDKIVEGNVNQIFYEELEIELDNGIKVIRKFWEVRKVEIKNE